MSVLAMAGGEFSDDSWAYYHLDVPQRALAARLTRGRTSDANWWWMRLLVSAQGVSIGGDWPIGPASDLVRKTAWCCPDDPEDV